jgi:hypothetical protein
MPVLHELFNTDLWMLNVTLILYFNFELAEGIII